MTIREEDGMFFILASEHIDHISGVLKIRLRVLLRTLWVEPDIRDDIVNFISTAKDKTEYKINVLLK